MNPLPPDDSSVAERLGTALSPNELEALEKIAALAASCSMGAYLVGGSVRDVLLGRPHYDIDVSIEGEAPALAALLEEQGLARIIATHRFGTAEIEWFDGRHIDLVTARSEWYEAPGALPTVEPGTILDDLARRDFTINAMAVGVRSEGLGALLDPHGGLGDLRAGLVRVLHDLSFIDDPTRIPRAVKYAVRLGFKIEPHTLELILLAVRDGALGTVSYDRIMREILLIMREPRAATMLVMLRNLGVLRAIHPDLDWPYSADSPVPPREDAPLEPHERRDVYLALLGTEFASDPAEAERLARSLQLDTRSGRIMRDAASLTALWPRLGEPGLQPAQVYTLLKRTDIETLQAFAHIEALAKDALAWQRLHDYLNRLRHIRPHVSGHFLNGIGVPPGPIYRRLLDDLRDAKLNGLVPSREDEERFVHRWLEKNEASGLAPSGKPEGDRGPDDTRGGVVR